MFAPEYTRTPSERNQVLGAMRMFAIRLEDNFAASHFVSAALLWLQAICQLFRAFHLPTVPNFPSIQIESRPAALVMAGNRYLNQCRMNGSSTRTRIR